MMRMSVYITDIYFPGVGNVSNYNLQELNINTVPNVSITKLKMYTILYTMYKNLICGVQTNFQFFHIIPKLCRNIL